MSTHLRVLHLEDSARDAEVVRDRLDVDGMACDILLVNNRGSFEAALIRESFDLIISDYNLPGYDGVAALRHAQLTRPNVPVILISGTVGEEDAVKCLHIGATDYLLKDRLDRLAPAVRRAIAEAEARRTRQRAEAALGESEARKAAILDSVLDCIVSIGGDGRVIEFNAAAERTFGYTKAEAVGHLLTELIIPTRFRDAPQAGMARYLEPGDGALLGKIIEIAAVRSDGSEIPVELAITALHSDHGGVFTWVMRDITARKLADDTRVRLAAIVESSDDAIVSMAMDDTILTWNAGAERLYGYPAREVIGRKRGFLIPEGRAAELPAMMATASRGEAGEPIETRRVRKDGSIVDISLVISPMADSDGRVTSVSTIARDITLRKQADASLLRERDRTQRYLDAAQVILLDLDLDGRIVLVNRYACAVLGWRCDELIGRDFVETCVPVRIRDAARQRFHALLGAAASVNESHVVTRSGEERLIEWHHAVLRAEAGHVIGTFSSGTDVTDRNEAAEALRAAEARMRFALESSNIGIWDADFATGVVQWSEILESQYGLQPGTFGGTFGAFIDRIHPDDREAVLSAIEQAKASGADFTLMHRAILPDGKVRWLSGAGRVVLGEQGEPVRAVGISLDVTERRTLEDQYQQAQKMEAIGRLAGGVAHDFNNLLTVILGFCELLLADLNQNDPRQADVREIRKAGERAAGLTRQLLAFSRKEIIQPCVLDLNTIVAEIRVMLGRLIGEDVTVVLDLGSASADINADRGQVEQIILNLAVNARDAMPKGGTLTIHTANVQLDAHYAKTHLAVKPGPYVLLTMTDTGTGMTPAVRNRLFEPFFTTKEVGKGTGLGLATVHGIVTRSGGSVTVESEVGAGTSFMMYFPRVAPAVPAAGGSTPPTRGSAAGQTVLVVDDAEGVRVLTMRLLRRQGYTVLVAANADQALRLCDEHPAIDLLLTDVVMPGISGPDLVKRLSQKWPQLKVIYMSGYTDEAIIHHGVLDPGIAFLHKPFTSEVLGDKIRSVLEG